MEAYLINQMEKCDHYQKVFEQQENTTMANRFAAYSVDSAKSLDLLRTSQKNNEEPPKYRFELINFNSSPINCDVRERELQLAVKVANLQVPSDHLVYIVAEFEYPVSEAKTLANSLGQKIRYAKIEPKRLCICSSEPSQLDLVYSTTEKPFTDPESEYLFFERPLTFSVEKGKSRTFKRKFKPIKLTFFQKTNFYRQDKKLGTVQVRIESINDEVSSVLRVPLMNGRKKTEADAEVKVRVREPLVDTSVRALEEKLLYLS